MKKFIATLLIVLYAGVSFGTSLYFHTCMGELKSVTINEEYHTSHTPECGMPMAVTKKNKCCQENVHQLKIKNEQQSSVNNFQFPALFPIYLGPENFHYSIAIAQLSAEAFTVQQAPPLPASSAVYLLVRSLRI